MGIQRVSALILIFLAFSDLPSGALAAGPEAGATGVVGTAGTANAKEQATVPVAASEVLARVNGAPITRAEVDRAILIFLAQSRASHDLTPEARKEAENAALEQLIGSKLLYQNGLKLNLSDLDRLVSEKVAQAQAKFPSSAAYEAALKTNNLTEPEAREIVRHDIVVTTVLERDVIAKITISEPDLRTFYRENLEKFTLPATVQISHILIETGPEATVEEKITARDKAEKLRSRLLAGEGFAALAKSESSCPSKEEGGDLGVFGKDEMVPEFEAAVATLKPGEISQVVETGYGFHVLKLVERKSVSVRSFDEAKKEIESFLTQTRTQQAIVDYVSELKKNATIVPGS